MKRHYLRPVLDLLEDRYVPGNALSALAMSIPFDPQNFMVSTDQSAPPL